MRLPSLLALSLSLFLPTSAYAQPATPQQTAAAQTLYEEATADLDAKRYASACRKLEDVTAVVPDALGAKLTLGECYEGLGKLASAWKQYTIVTVMAAVTEQTERKKRATAKAAALWPRVATVLLKVHWDVASIPGITIFHDRVPVDEAQWGKPLPVDTGSHEITATAPGRKTWRKHVEVTDDGTAVSVVIKAPAPEVAVTDEPVSDAIPAPTARPAYPAAPGAAPVPGWQQPIGYTAMGLGAVGVSVGGVLGFLAMMQHQGSNNDHQVLADGAIAATIAGGVMLAGGIVLFATTPSERESQKSAGRGRGVQVQLELLPGGLGVRGTW